MAKKYFGSDIELVGGSQIINPLIDKRATASLPTAVEGLLATDTTLHVLAFGDDAGTWNYIPKIDDASPFTATGQLLVSTSEYTQYAMAPWSGTKGASYLTAAGVISTVAIEASSSGDTFGNSSIGLQGGNDKFASAKAIKEYVDLHVSYGIHWRPPVDCSLNSASASLPVDIGTQVDGISITNNMRVLVVDSGTAGEDTKIYLATVVGSVISWTVQRDETSADLPTDGDTVWIKSGTLRADQQWSFNGTSWIQIAGASYYTAGEAITFGGGSGTAIALNIWGIGSAATIGGSDRIPFATANNTNKYITYTNLLTVFNSGLSFDNYNHWDLRVTTDTDVPIASGAFVKFIGTSPISLSLNTTTLTIGLDTVPVSKGGTGATTLLINALLYGNTQNAIQSLVLPTVDYAILQGRPTTAPSWTTYAMPVTPVSTGVLYASSSVAITNSDTFTFNSNILALGKKGTAGTLKLFNASGSTNAGSMVFAMATGDVANITYTFPSSHVTSGFLQNDGSGNLSWSTSALTDEKVKIKSGSSVSKYLYSDGSGNDGALRVAANSGLAFVDAGDYMTAALDFSTLVADTAVTPATDYIAVYTDSLTKKMLISDFQKISGSVKIYVGSITTASSGTILVSTHGCVFSSTAIVQVWVLVSSTYELVDARIEINSSKDITWYYNTTITAGKVVIIG